MILQKCDRCQKDINGRTPYFQVFSAGKVDVPAFGYVGGPISLCSAECATEYFASLVEHSLEWHTEMARHGDDS